MTVNERQSPRVVLTDDEFFRDEPVQRADAFPALPARLAGMRYSVTESGVAVTPR